MYTRLNTLIYFMYICDYISIYVYLAYKLTAEPDVDYEGTDLRSANSETSRKGSVATTELRSALTGTLPSLYCSPSLLICFLSFPSSFFTGSTLCTSNNSKNRVIEYECANLQHLKYYKDTFLIQENTKG